MNIKGEFEVTLLNQKTFETTFFKGENLITEFGKKHLTNWLKHDNYSDFSYLSDKLSGGKTFLNEKIISYTEISATNYYTDNLSSRFQSKNSNDCLYAPLKDSSTYSLIGNYDYSRFESMNDSHRKECSIYFNFSENKSIKKIILQCSPCNYTGTSNGSGCQLEISTSPNHSDDNINWTIRKHAMLPANWNVKYEKDTNGYNTSKIDLSALYDLPIYFGDRNDPEKSIQNVKSIRITPSYQGIKIYRIVFVEEVDYPSPPCIIGLGTSDVTPDVKDVDLGNRVCTLLAKCNCIQEENSLPYVTYRTRLGIKEYNGNIFREIGLYCTDDGVLPYKGSKLNLFSHGLFENPWEKNSDVIADIKYTLTFGE